MSVNTGNVKPGGGGPIAMAAAIVKQRPVSDGFDVDATDTGVTYHLHFVSQPANVQTAVDAAIAGIIAGQEATWEVKSENGTII